MLCNSLYGALNAILKGALYCRPLGGIVTACGRLAISAIQDEVAGLPNASVVAGDTDSVMFKLEGRTLEEAAKEGERVAAAVTRTLRLDGARAMTLSYEKVMLPSCFVAKKAYLYTKYEDAFALNDGRHTSMGLLSKKRGNPQILKNAFIDCESIYLLPISEFTREQVRSLQLLVLRELFRELSQSNARAKAEPAWLDMFVKTTMLLDNYDASYHAAHVDAARRLCEATGCIWPGGQRIKVLIAQDTDRRHARLCDKSYEMSHFKDLGFDLDLQHYLLNVCGRFNALLQFTIDDIAARFDAAIATLGKPRQQSSVAGPWRHSAGLVLGDRIANLSFAELRQALDAHDAFGTDFGNGASAFRDAPLGAPPPKREPKLVKAEAAASQAAANQALAPAWASLFKKRAATEDETAAKVARKRQSMVQNSRDIASQPRGTATNRVG